VLPELEGGYGDEPHSDDAKEEELSVFPTTILLATDGSPQAETAAHVLWLNPEAAPTLPRVR
jgi:hypothetical protein